MVALASILAVTVKQMPKFNMNKQKKVHKYKIKRWINRPWRPDSTGA